MSFYIAAADTPIGHIELIEENGVLTTALLNPAKRPESLAETPLLQEAKKQLRSYFSGSLRQFKLPLAPAGTAFQRQVWQALLHIPYGKTASYHDIAKEIGNPGACRAVGSANGANPLPIFIPCHRVIASDGSLGGYSGGLEIKRFLLELEHAHC